MQSSRYRPRIALAVVLTTLPLAACGGGSSKSTAQAPRGVYTSSGDCAEAGRLSFEQCATAMEQAVTTHEKAAPTYASLKACEKTEGEERCERTSAGGYRPQLLAFLVVAGEPPTARPLYAAPDGKEGFRAADKSLLLASDETLTFSEHALTLAEGAVGTKKKRRGS